MIFNTEIGKRGHRIVILIDGYIGCYSDNISAL
jgi:hypothetical protein